ncbi:hypothetical protein LEP1GSC148_4142 [Leptospira interrogans serovar Canicola str. LT1962]|nr:hypothetical protein LEP1GSC148_4142 [Leptospira interrogans serovar Canicola str. LT1962]
MDAFSSSLVVKCAAPKIKGFQKKVLDPLLYQSTSSILR